ncbi:MAG: hypothetical protein CM1200mP31_3370 [Candidatus Neomarinimicrobiota bacterium]|nr:MAG: hypothetical protein CM1200mP31_3370 [Candidatus Neomarinimicrobiota bacterium]
MVGFIEFFSLFLPSLINYIIPAFIMSLFVSGSSENVKNTPGSVKNVVQKVSYCFSLSQYY